MNVWSWLLWGLAATVVMVSLMSAGQGLGLTRMSLPYMLGTFVTPDRDKAKLLGFCLHLLNGWAFSLLYVALFSAWRRATWWLGGAVGLLHGAAVLTIGMQLLPALHPRMASATQGPTVTRQLEPPGFLAMNYGPRTALWTVAAHLVYGVILGAFYRVAA